MKIGIKKFRTIKETEILINENQINYFIGSNESGKSNIFDSIRGIGKVTDINNKNNFISFSDNDAMVINSNPGKADDIEFYIKEGDNVNLIDSSTRESMWLSKEFPVFKEYKKLVENGKNDFEEIKNKINGDYTNWDSKLGIKKILLKNLLDIFNQIQKFTFINKNNLEILESKESYEYLSKYKKTLESIINIHKNKIVRPLVYFVEPIVNAKKNEKIQLDWSELKLKDSFLKKVTFAFSSDESIKALDEINKSEGQIDPDISRKRRALLKAISKSIAKYFSDDLKYLKGLPELSSEGTKIILDIENNKNYNYEIDSGNEESRSLGFKSFLRMIFEIKTLSKTKEKIFYIIDEPEQGLHPFLQELLMKQILNITSKKDNKITFIISSHSPYIINLSDDFEKYKNNLNFVFREPENKEEITSGETIVRKISDNDFEERILTKWKNLSDDSYLYDEEMYLLRMVLDSKHLNNFNKAIKNKIKDIQKLMKTDEKKAKENFKKVMEIKDIFK